MKRGFTLAEVLITLGIIGVIAALTIPSLTANFQVKSNITKLKKFYSVISQAYAASVMENGTIDKWELTYTRESVEFLYKNLSEHMKVIKNCGSEKGCMPDTGYTRYTDTGWSLNFNGKEDRYNAVLADGSVMSLLPHIPEAVNDDYYANVYIDINGSKGPNKWGVDLF